jgi:hypothetical protein
VGPATSEAPATPAVTRKNERREKMSLVMRFVSVSGALCNPNEIPAHTIRVHATGAATQSRGNRMKPAAQSF